MLRVSEEQLSALEAHFTLEFVDRMTDDLFDAFPAKCHKKGRERVVAFVEASIGRGREATATTIESDWRMWVVTEFVLGPKMTRQICEEKRDFLMERDGRVDPTLLVILTYQEMFAKIEKPSDPEPPQEEYNPVDEAST